MNYQNFEELNFEFNSNDYTAKVIESPNASGEVLIPTTVNYQNHDYIVTSISKYAFKSNIDIKSVNFPADSKLFHIEKKAFFKSSIQSIFLPQSIEKIEEGCFHSTQKLISVSVSPKNKFFQFYNRKFLVKKSNEKSAEYDILFFARRDIKEGQIPRFIKHICKYCFCDCKKLVSIQFSKDSKIISINKSCFFNSSIKSIQFPASLEILQEGWCKRTPQLKSINLSQNSKKFSCIDNQILLEKSDLKNENFDILNFAARDIKKAVIPSFIKVINASAFSECKQLKTVEFEDKTELEIIGKDSFHFTSIEKISIPSSVIKIDKKSFFFCKKLKTVEIPKESRLCSIGSLALGITSIDKFFIPKEVTLIDEKAFNNTNSLSSIEFSEHSKLTKIGDFAFSLTGIKSIRIPSSVVEIGGNSFANCYSLTSVEFEENSKLDIIRKYAFSYSSLEAIEIPKSVKTIEEKAFYSCKSLDSFKIDENSEIKTIENYSFYDTNLRSLFIPSNVTELKDEWCCEIKYLINISVSKQNKNFIFYDDKFLLGKTDSKSDKYDILLFARRDIECAIIPSFIKKIGCFAFSDCMKLKSIEFSKDSELLVIDKSAFSYSSIERITIPSSVCQIGEFAFCSNNLKTIDNFENTKIRTIESDLFQWSSIRNLSIPSTVEELKEGWSRGTPYLVSINVSNKNDNFNCIDNKIIYGKSNNENNIFDVFLFASRDIEEIIIPSFIKKISSYSFTECMKLKRIEFQEKSELYSIEENAFGATQIDRISIPSNTEKIGKFAFYECKKLKVIEFQPDSKLSLIEENAFSGSSITSISVPSNVKFIQKGTFSDCNELCTVEFLGSEIIFEHFIDSQTNFIKIFSFPNAHKIVNIQFIIPINSSVFVLSGAEII